MKYFQDYNEYTNFGGVLDITAYSRNIDRACGIIDNATHCRIEVMSEIPTQAKALCRDLIEFFYNNSDVSGIIASKSQSAGAVSESVSYTSLSKEQQDEAIDNMICDYLLSVKDDNGTPLLYRGCIV